MSELPTYAYRPPAKPDKDAKIRSCTSRRARLWAGGTYFRSRDVGASNNRISIEMVELAPTSGPGTGEAYLVVMNHNLRFPENVLGPATPQILNLDATYSDYWRLEQLDTPTPLAKYHSISVEIRNSLQQNPALELLNPTIHHGFAFDKFFRIPKLSVKLQKTAPNLTPEDVIIITPRVKIYPLSGGIKTVLPTEMMPAGQTTVGWDIEALRSVVNAQDEWIEMPKRGSLPVGGVGVQTPGDDAQDEKVDDDFLTSFPMTYLAGGDGLPANPNDEHTGPSRTLVLVRQGEKQDGSLGDINTIYEWVGDSAMDGTWKPYPLSNRR